MNLKEKLLTGQEGEVCEDGLEVCEDGLEVCEDGLEDSVELPETCAEPGVAQVQQGHQQYHHHYAGSERRSDVRL